MTVSDQFISAGVFGARDMAALKDAFDATCERLKIAVEDEEIRHRIAAKLLHLASGGERDAEKLLTAIQAL